MQKASKTSRQVWSRFLLLVHAEGRCCSQHLSGGCKQLWEYAKDQELHWFFQDKQLWEYAKDQELHWLAG